MQGPWCGELGKDRVSEEDITSLPLHHCYVRATVGTERLPAFSMAVRRPERGNPYTAALIRATTAAYTTAVRDIAETDAGARKLVDRFHEGLAALKDGEVPPETEEPSAGPPDAERRKRRTKHHKADEASEEDGTDEEQDDGAALEDTADEERDE